MFEPKLPLWNLISIQHLIMFSCSKNKYMYRSVSNSDEAKKIEYPHKNLHLISDHIFFDQYLNVRNPFPKWLKWVFFFHWYFQTVYWFWETSGQQIYFDNIEIQCMYKEVWSRLYWIKYQMCIKMIRFQTEFPTGAAQYARGERDCLIVLMF